MPDTYITFSTRYCDLGKAKRAVSKSNKDGDRQSEFLNDTDFEDKS